MLHFSNLRTRAPRLILAATLAGWLAGLSAHPALAQGTPGATDGPMNHNDTRVHPGFTLKNLIPPGAPAVWPRVSGMDFLPNGDLVFSTWDGFGTSATTSRPGRVYIMKNVQTGDSAQVTFTQLGTANMNEPLGLKVVNGEIYIIEKDSLVHLIDSNKDQVLDSKRRIASGWTRNPTDNTNKDLQFMHGLVYTPDNKFIAGMATRWNNNGPVASTGTNGNHDGCIISMELGLTNYQVIACGIRSPDGIVLGPEDGIFVTDNQGNYLPAAKLLHIKQGRFFNVYHSPASPFESTTVTRPVIWLADGTSISSVGRSPTQPVYVRNGVFKGQMLAGENIYGTIQRYFLEKVGGEYQGAAFRFSGGLRAAAHRMITGPDGAIYVGEIGGDDFWGGWSWGTRRHGLQQLKETGAPFFDVVAVRSTGPTTFELDFTEPVNSATVSNFPTAQHWAYNPDSVVGGVSGTYGCCKRPTLNLTVQSVSLSPDKKTITVTIPGLVRSNVVYLRWTGLTAVSGRPLMTDRMWYTLNEFGPGVQVTVKPDPARRIRLSGARALADGHIAVRLGVQGLSPETVGIYDVSGALLESIDARVARGSAGELSSARAYRPGVYMVSAGDGAARISHKVTVF